MDMRSGTIHNWPLPGDWHENRKWLRLMRATWYINDWIIRTSRPKYEWTEEDLETRIQMEGDDIMRVKRKSEFQKWLEEQDG